MSYKLLGILIIGAAVALAVLTLQDDLVQLSAVSGPQPTQCVQLTPAEQFNKLINDDFAFLGREGHLPAEWAHIATVEYRMNSTLAKALLGKARPEIQRIKDGTAYLEMEVMDLPDDENPGVIVQASLFDIKTKNKIFEIGRTYTMLALNDPAAAREAAQAEAAEDAKTMERLKAAASPTPTAPQAETAPAAQPATSAAPQPATPQPAAPSTPPPARK